jgi:hypothetical protein
VKYRYAPYQVSPSPAEPGVTIAYRPAIPVRIIGLSGSVLLWGVLDTGADESILPAYLLERLQVATRAGDVDVLSGADGRPFVVTYGTVDFEVQLDDHAARWHAKVAFDPHRVDPLFGQVGFLRHFTVTFDGPGRFVMIEATGAFPPAIMPDR